MRRFVGVTGAVLALSSAGPAFAQRGDGAEVLEVSRAATAPSAEGEQIGVEGSVRQLDRGRRPGELAQAGCHQHPARRDHLRRRGFDPFRVHTMPECPLS